MRSIVGMRLRTTRTGANPTQNTTTETLSITLASTIANNTLGGADTIFGPIVRTLAGGANESLDFNGGGLTDHNGNTIALARVKLVYVHLLGAAQTLVDGEVGTAASSISLTGNLLIGAGRPIVSGSKPILNGSTYLDVYNTAAGYTVTGGATDTITVTNNDGAVAADYLICVIGGSS